LVFAASREEEFVDKIKGLSYADIAARGGGILNSAAKLNGMPEETLYNLAKNRLAQAIKSGTGAIEIKSGYGLSVEGELKMLRVIKRLKKEAPIPVKATFLGAHSYPPEYKENHQGYIDLIINEMLPVIAHEKLADYIDVFCETGFFSGRNRNHLQSRNENRIEAKNSCQSAQPFGWSTIRSEAGSRVGRSFGNDG
jgi:imidazolonepropionase